MIRQKRLPRAKKSVTASAACRALDAAIAVRLKDNSLTSSNCGPIKQSPAPLRDACVAWADHYRARMDAELAPPCRQSLPKRIRR
jgi:hypothetical protein